MDIIPVATTAAAVPTAVAAVWWFLYRRELEPSTELGINVVFVGHQKGQLLIEIEATLSNKSSVRQEYRDFSVSVRYLLSDDQIEDGGKRIRYQLKFPRSINTRIKTDPGTKTARLFANAEYIDPRTTFRHSYITSVPEDATFVWVHCKMLFRTRESWRSLRSVEHVKDGQRLFAVPKNGTRPYI